MSKKFVVDTERAPRAIGPYSQAVGFGNLIFVSGLYPQDPHTGEFSRAGIEMQTRRALDNLMGILLAAGLDASHVVKMTVYLRNMNDYHLMNEAYSSYFDYAPPARTVVEVNRLQRDALIAIDAVAAAPVDYETHAEEAVAPPPAEPDTPLDHPGPDDYDDSPSDESLAEDEAGRDPADDASENAHSGEDSADGDSGETADDAWESIDLDEEGSEVADDEGDSKDDSDGADDESDSEDESEDESEEKSD